MPRLVLPAAAAAVTFSLLPARPAVADTPSSSGPNAALAWGVAAGELSTAAVFYLNFGTDLVPNHGPGMIVNFAPMLIAPAVGWGARHADPAPAFAVHGAGWLGLDLFMLGSLIDGRGERDRMKVGTAALTLGALGAIGGGILGATQIGDDDEAAPFLAGPPLGFVAGGVVLGGLLVLAGGIDGDKAPSQFATGAIAGLTIGLGVASYAAFRGGLGGDGKDATSRVTPAVQPGPRRFVVSFGGAF